jgi:hypothetical protein
MCVFAYSSRNSEKLCGVRISVSVVLVARKLSKIEESGQDHSCLFQRGD